MITFITFLCPLIMKLGGGMLEFYPVTKWADSVIISRYKLYHCANNMLAKVYASPYIILFFSLFQMSIFTLISEFKHFFVDLSCEIYEYIIEWFKSRNWLVSHTKLSTKWDLPTLPQPITQHAYSRWTRTFDTL